MERKGEKMNLVPLTDRLIIERLKAETVLKSGIALPQASQKEQIDRGIVLAISAENELKLKVGDTILFSPHAGIEYEYNNKKYLILKESGISARLKRKNES